MTKEEGLEDSLQTLFKQIRNDLELKQCRLLSLFPGYIFLSLLTPLGSILLKPYLRALVIKPVLEPAELHHLVFVQ